MMPLGQTTHTHSDNTPDPYKGVRVCVVSPGQQSDKSECPSDGRQRFEIILEGSDDVTPVVIRLRQLLKLAGRAYRFRCVEAKQVGTGETVEHDERREARR